MSGSASLGTGRVATFGPAPEPWQPPRPGSVIDDALAAIKVLRTTHQANLQEVVALGNERHAGMTRLLATALEIAGSDAPLDVRRSAVSQIHALLKGPQ